MSEHFTEKSIDLIDQIVLDPPQASISLISLNPDEYLTGQVDLSVEFNESTDGYKVFQYFSSEDRKVEVGTIKCSTEFVNDSCEVGFNFNYSFSESSNRSLKYVIAKDSNFNNSNFYEKIVTELFVMLPSLGPHTSAIQISDFSIGNETVTLKIDLSEINNSFFIRSLDKDNNEIESKYIDINGISSDSVMVTIKSSKENETKLNNSLNITIPNLVPITPDPTIPGHDGFRITNRSFVRLARQDFYTLGIETGIGNFSYTVDGDVRIGQYNSIDNSFIYPWDCCDPYAFRGKVTSIDGKIDIYLVPFGEGFESPRKKFVKSLTPVYDSRFYPPPSQ